MADKAKNINHQYVMTLIDGLVNLPFLYVHGIKVYVSKVTRIKKIKVYFVTYEIFIPLYLFVNCTLYKIFDNKQRD